MYLFITLIDTWCQDDISQLSCHHYWQLVVMYLYAVVGIFYMMSVLVLIERINLTLFVHYSNDLEQVYILDL